MLWPDAVFKFRIMMHHMQE